MPNQMLLTCFFFPTVAKGISANMLKHSSKRRRTKAQVKADKEMAVDSDAQMRSRDEQIE